MRSQEYYQEYSRGGCLLPEKTKSKAPPCDHSLFSFFQKRSKGKKEKHPETATPEGLARDPPSFRPEDPSRYRTSFQTPAEFQPFLTLLDLRLPL